MHERLKEESRQDGLGPHPEERREDPGLCISLRPLLSFVVALAVDVVVPDELLCPGHCS